MHILTILQGFGFEDLGLFLNRFLPGLFFVTYRFRWVYDPSSLSEKCWFSDFRRTKLRAKLAECQYGCSHHLAGTVAIVEILGGLGLMSGLLAVPSALGLFVIMCFANCCAPKTQLPAMKPIDSIDCIACYLQLPEPLYLVMVANVIILGPGKWSLDYVWTQLL